MLNDAHPLLPEVIAKVSVLRPGEAVTEHDLAVPPCQALHLLGGLHRTGYVFADRLPAEEGHGQTGIRVVGLTQKGRERFATLAS